MNEQILYWLVSRNVIIYPDRVCDVCNEKHNDESLKPVVRFEADCGGDSAQICFPHLREDMFNADQFFRVHAPKEFRLTTSARRSFDFVGDDDLIRLMELVREAEQETWEYTISDGWWEAVGDRELLVMLHNLARRLINEIAYYRDTEGV